MEVMYDPLNPYPWYKSMRETHPVFYDEQRKLWQVFGYDDVRRVLFEYTTFSSQIPIDPSLPPFLTTIDPPRHNQLRSLVASAFTPRAIEKLTPRIREITQELLNKVIDQGHMDVVDDLATQLPILVITELLGVPREDQQQVRVWVREASDVAMLHDLPALQQMAAYFQQIIEQRKKAPQDDLLSGLLEARVDGQPLTEHEILGCGMLFLMAGGETTQHLISHAILGFDAYPDVQEQLRGKPTLLPTAIEEFLRYRSPFPNSVRVTTCETTLAAQRIEAGQLVLACIGSANHDEKYFHDPEHLDIRRSPNPHLALGHGIHFCIGAPLARLEARIALETMLEQLDSIRRVQETPLEPTGEGLVYGVKHLPITFSRFV